MELVRKYADWWNVPSHQLDRLPALLPTVGSVKVSLQQMVGFAGKGADLAIIECYMFEGEPRFHMSWRRIEANLDRIGARRVMLTHMAEPMLARRSEVTDPRVILAEDGLSIVI